MKQSIKLSESQLREVIKESIENVLAEENVKEGINGLKTGAKTFFGHSGNLRDKWMAAKKNFNTQNEFDDLSNLKAQLTNLLDARQISPNTTVAQLVGGKYNGNKFGTMSGMLGNRQSQMNYRMR